MNDKIAELLEKLAVKLGTTAEHLWGVLVKQAHIEGMTSVIIWSIWGIIVVFLAMFFSLVRTDTYEEKNTMWGIWIAIFIVTFVIFASCISTIIGQFNNPEYWALTEVIRNIK